MMVSPIDVAHQLLKIHYDPDFGIKPGDFDPSGSAYHDNAEEEAYSRDDSKLTHGELAFILPDDVWDRLEERYDKEIEDDWEHHVAMDYYDAHDTSMANYIESYLEEEMAHHRNNDLEIPDYLLDWEAARNEKLNTYDYQNWEPTFDVMEFDRRNWEWDNELQDMVYRGDISKPIDMAFRILKRDEGDINPLTPDERRELYRLQDEAEDIRMYYGDVWLLGIGDLYEEIKTTTSVERARELLAEMRERLR